MNIRKLFTFASVLILTVSSIVVSPLTANPSVELAPIELSPGDCITIISGDTVSRICNNSVGVTSTATMLPSTLTQTSSPTNTGTMTATVTNTSSAVPTQTSTATLSPTFTATSTRTATRTLTPSPTLTHVHTGHDTTRWHSISNNDHEHGDNPNNPDIVAIFGPAGQLWNQGTGANIGVPFETSPIENTMKHPMAKYYTMLPSQIDAAWEGAPNMAESSDNGGTLTANRVRAWRILAHGGANLMEALGNNHSAFVEVQICTRSTNQCGTFSSGGWIFWGRLQAPFYNQTHERPGGTIAFPDGMTMTFKSDSEDLQSIGSPNSVFDDWGGEPYWFMFPTIMPDGFNALNFARSNPGLNIGDQISSNEVGPNNLADCAPFPTGSLCGNRLFHLAIRIFDGWNLLNTSNVNNPAFICTQLSPSNCSYNGSYRGMKEVDIFVNPAWDGTSFDTDPRVGFVSMNRFTDRYQRLRPIGACTTIGVDCVPLVLVNVPVGYAAIKLKIQEPVPGIDREYDCPGGGCISFPN